MFELKIDNASTAYGHIINGWATKAVSLIGESLRFPIESTGPQHLVLVFDDTELADDPDWVSPTRDHVRAVLSHTADLTDDDRLVVHCHAGKSRSTAMAIGILIQHGMSPQAAFDHVRSIRPILIPNRLIIAYLDEILEQDGALEEVISAYYRTLMLPGITLPDRGGWNR